MYYYVKFGSDYMSGDYNVRVLIDTYITCKALARNSTVIICCVYIDI